MRTMMNQPTPNRVVIARPVGEWEPGGEFDWAGNVTPRELIWELCQEAGVFPGSHPSRLGKALLHAYWTCDANIEHWWANTIPTINCADDEPWWDSSSMDGIDDTVRWIYIGMPRALIVKQVVSENEYLHLWVPWSETKMLQAQPFR